MMRLIAIITSIIGLLLSNQSLATNKPFINIKHWQTEKGIPVYFVESHEIPMVDVLVSFYAGSAYDGNQLGLAALTNNSLAAGTKQHDANSIAEQFARTGAQFSNTLNKDIAVLSLRTMSTDKYLKPVTKIFTEILHQPSFPTSEVNRERDELLALLQYQQQLPNAIANQTFDQLLYQNHPYAHADIGKPETVKTLTAQDTRKFYQQYYVAENANIIIVGDQTVTQAKSLAEKISQSLQQGHKAPRISAPTATIKTKLKEINFPSEQTHILMGQKSINYNNPAFIPLHVGNYIFGGRGFSSLLFQEIRKKQGLTYGAYSQFTPQLTDGNFTITLATRNEQAQAATVATQQLLQNYTKQGPSEEQVTFAKQFLLGNLPLQFASNTAIAGALLKLAIYQLPIDFYDNYQSSIQALDQQTIHKTWQQYIHPEQIMTVRVGKHVAQ